MSDDRLAEIRARLYAATPGPWECVAEEVKEDENGSAHFLHHIQVTNDADHDDAGEMIVYGSDWSDRRTNFSANDQFIAHSREDVEWLLAAYDAWEASAAYSDKVRAEHRAWIAEQAAEIERLRGDPGQTHHCPICEARARAEEPLDGDFFPWA